jgi:DNA-binding beta-propeller fold protein YncE
VAAAASAQIPLIEAEPAGVLAPEGSLALNMPSDAVRLPGERWAILDGVNNRVVITDDEGRGLSTIGEGILASPLGLTIGPAGRLWIADSGHARVVALGSDGTVEAEAELVQRTRDSHRPDPVDLAFDRDGKTLLIVDNDNHRVDSLDTVTGAWGSSWGRLGPALDEFNHPFTIAVGPSGERAVVDVINSRVQSHDPEFDFTFQIGRWGVDAGELYRPKGVAVDANGQVYVSDSVLGLIQVFSRVGDLVGVLSDGDAPRHFTTPARLAFDEQGRLAVVEMGANRVSLWEIHR